MSAYLDYLASLMDSPLERLWKQIYRTAGIPFVKREAYPSGLQRATGVVLPAPDSGVALTPVGKRHFLAPDAARAFLAAQRAFGGVIKATSSYRPYSVQKALYAAMLAGKTKGPVAPPGRSRHQYGLAVDIAPGASRNWMARYGKAYGWVQPLPRSDPAHFEYRGV